jgi:hypothetical protein
LGRRKGNHFIVLIIPEIGIKIVKVAAGGPGDHDTLTRTITHCVKSPFKANKGSQVIWWSGGQLTPRS